MGDVLMRRELLSVVEGDGVHEVADRLEATHGCPLCCVGGRTREVAVITCASALGSRFASENSKQSRIASSLKPAIDDVVVQPRQFIFVRWGIVHDDPAIALRRFRRR
jgi:hypothetical protein